MSLPKSYNPRFIQYFSENARPDLQTLGEYGVSILKNAEPTAFRVIGVHHLSGTENGGKHHIYADILDENGQRINGALIKVQVGNNPPTYATVDKPAIEPGTNAPMWGGTQYQVSVANHPSDTVIGLHTGHADELGGGNTWGHHSFYVVFQRRPVQYVPEPVPPEQPPTVEQPDTTTIEQQFRILVDKVVAMDAGQKRLEQKVDDALRKLKQTAAIWQ